MNLFLRNSRHPLQSEKKGLGMALAKYLAALFFCVTLIAGGTALAEDKLKLEPGQRVIISGNTFAERMALYGYFETALYCAYPTHDLTVRNLGWSGDEVDLMPRADNTGTYKETLTWHKADVVFLCFGMNESFAGEEGLEPWRTRLTKFVTDLKAQKFNGKSAPKLVLVSPIAHEDLGAPLPTGKAIALRNATLNAYTNVMAEVASEAGIIFADLFEPMKKRMEAVTNGDRKLTVNGIHLNELGYFHASRTLAQSLGLLEADSATEANAEELRRAVHEKNYFYHLCWRPLNPYYIWGGRAWCWEADQPMDELEQIGAYVRQLDKAISASKKPPVATVWGRIPTGVELWEETVRYDPADIPEKGEAPRMETVRRNGARPKR